MDRPEPEPKPQYSILLQVPILSNPFQKNPNVISLPTTAEF
jgi:hypothetical protein